MKYLCVEIKFQKELKDEFETYQTSKMFAKVAKHFFLFKDA
jgi:hypothetical protein